MNDMGIFRPLGIRCNHEIREYSCCILCRFSACTFAYARTYMYSHVHVRRTVFAITPDTIAYAKVSGADNIAWQTQLHLTPGFTEVKVMDRNHWANLTVHTSCLSFTSSFPSSYSHWLCSIFMELLEWMQRVVWCGSQREKTVQDQGLRKCWREVSSFSPNEGMLFKLLWRQWAPIQW